MEAYKDGRAKAIGLSNFEPEHIDAILASSDVPVTVLQSEFHPFLFRPELLKYLAKHDIVFEAYGSMNAKGLLRNPVVAEVAAQARRTPAQVLLRWALQHGCVILPKSVHRARIVENAQLDFELSEVQMLTLNALNTGTHSYWSGIGEA